MMAVKRLTQKDIARLAGVSQATVSLVLNGTDEDSRRIPEQTRARIQEVIARTGYVADPVARRMVKGRNNILGVFTYEPAFPSAQADFFGPFLFGIEEAAQERGYDLLLMTAAARGRDGRKKIFDETNRLRLADGCIVLGRSFDQEELTRLVAGDFPFVAVGRRDDAGGPVPYVGADYAAATGDLVALAHGHGHRAFAYVGPDEGAESTVDRWRGFSGALEGQAELVRHWPEVGSDPQAVLKAVREAGATVTFFTELADAIPFRRAAIAEGLSVPGDMSVVVLGSHLRPGVTGTNFTAYAIPREEMGRRATLALVDQLEGHGGIEQTLLSCERVEGETLGPIKTNE
ncbi:LacI family DNA-binding transcriptional regulator [Pelagibacterium sp. H642]|uniref:LacI family DNA-binding transcriptional regulator n=1 Tax=Pelagibacterium sp. H642 TaxID=1881069 RepID=UPI002815E0F5|nr:LacI family DNA-binding transcriptional regulator [Pelagibacterium sp. H642]WMT92454.1 LacI family transcriptional regulator [Pelagibacterium sp. H642]